MYLGELLGGQQTHRGKLSAELVIGRFPTRYFAAVVLQDHHEKEAGDAGQIHFFIGRPVPSAN